MSVTAKKPLKSIRTHSVEANHKAIMETRAENLDKRIVEGYAVIWDVKNSHYEVFHRGSFLKAINDLGPNSGSNFKIKFRHEHYETVGLFAEMYEDEIGLYFRTQPLDKGDLEDEILKKLKSGVYNNFSIGFRYVNGKYSWDQDTDTLHIFEANLKEISVVGLPSDESTFAIRSSDEGIDELSENTEKFIASLPRSFELQARHLFATYQTLAFDEQSDRQSAEALKGKGEQSDKDSHNRSLDFDYISKNL